MANPNPDVVWIRLLPGFWLSLPAVGAGVGVKDCSGDSGLSDLRGTTFDDELALGATLGFVAVGVGDGVGATPI